VKEKEVNNMNEEKKEKYKGFLQEEINDQIHLSLNKGKPHNALKLKNIIHKED
jgi:hypothetical protein